MTDEESSNPNETQAFIECIRKLRNSDIYSDLTIKCKDEVFKVHRAIICTQSKPLAAMVNGNWSEAKTGTINLADDDPLMVAKMIDFLYKTRYNDDRTIDEEDLKDIADQHSLAASLASPAEPESNQSAITALQPTDYIKGPLVTNAKVYILGDKYDIPSLKDVAARKYQEIIKDMWNHHTFGESAKIVYDNIVSENDALKKAIVEVITENKSQLLKRDDFISVLRSNGDIAADLLCALPEAPIGCSNCESYSYPICNNCHNTLRF